MMPIPEMCLSCSRMSEFFKIPTSAQSIDAATVERLKMKNFEFRISKSPFKVTGLLMIRGVRTTIRVTQSSRILMLRVSWVSDLM